jgi:chromosome partitioning protein
MEQGMPTALRGATQPLGRAAGHAAPVRQILVINAKGGCGKTTIATNLASYYARQGRGTVLIDHDPQGSSMQWLSLRSKEAKPIHGVSAHRPVVSGVTRSFLLRIPDGAERVVLDAPAGVQGHQLIELMREIDAILIPVLPSPIDIHAASRFVQDLLLVAKVRARNIRVGVVANRVRENTKVYQSLEKFLNSLNIPFVARLRDTQNYVRAAETGVGVHDIKRSGAAQDQRQWEALIRWLEQN